MVPPVDADFGVDALGAVGLQTGAGVVYIFTHVAHARQVKRVHRDNFVALFENTALQNFADFRKAGCNTGGSCGGLNTRLSWDGPLFSRGGAGLYLSIGRATIIVREVVTGAALSFCVLSEQGRRQVDNDG